MTVPFTDAPSTIPVAQAVTEFLKAQGIRYVFGKIGEDVLPLLNRIAGEETINFISTYSEETAVLMADGCARASRRPSVVLTSGGGGAARTTAAVAQAICDGSPVILLAGELPTSDFDRENTVTHGLKQDALFETTTRSSNRVAHPHRVVASLEQTYRSAAAGKMGPAYCGIPRDLLLQETPERIRHYSQFMTLGRPSGDPELIRRATEILMGAQNPLILAGGGVVWSGATSEVIELAEFLFAPIVSSNGKSGIVPDDYPLAIGRLGSKANKVAVQTVPEADVIVCLGCTLNDRTTFGFSAEIFAPDAKLIQIDIDPRQIGGKYPVEVGIIGDAKTVLRVLLSSLRQMGAEKWPSKVIHRIQKVWERKEDWNREWSRLARSSEVPIRRLRLLKDVADEVGRQGIILGDMEWKHCLNTSYFPIIEAHDFNLSGSNVGLAIGVKLALPDRPVIAAVGDGQFITTLSDVATAVEHRIPIVVVVAKNGCYGKLKATQTQYFDGRYIGVDHPFPNFADVALSLGAYGECVQTPAEIRPAVRRALKSGRPAVIEVAVSTSIGDLKPVFD